METNGKLTSANIRYLLTIKAFTDSRKPVRGAYLAEYLHYKKSSVHSMLQNLMELGMIEKSADNLVHLTEKGADTAFRYQMYYSRLDTAMQQCLPGFENRENAVLALLAEVPEQILQNLRSAE